MNIQDLGAIAEIVGAFAVVLTLIYLARQIRENARQLNLTSTLALNSLINQGFDPIYNNENNMQIWTTGLREPEELSEADLEMFFLFFTRLMNPFETVVTHYNRNALDEDAFQRYASFWRNIAATPGGKAWFDAEHMVLTNTSKSILGFQDK